MGIDPETTSPPPPARFVVSDALRADHGHRVDLLAPWFHRADPMADACVRALGTLRPRQGQALLDRGLSQGVDAIPHAPMALRAFVASLDAMPLWVDRAQLTLGGRAYLRSGVLGLLVLACGSLPTIYACPAGNKPLTLSRRLVAMAPRRLLETAQFVHEVSGADGLLRGAPGHRITARVRLIHAQMRRLVLRSDRWDAAAWGAPINQVDLAYTNLQFSVNPLRWLEMLGLRMHPEERDALVHLWRYAGHLMGVDPTLLVSTEAEGRRLGDLIARAQEPPDDDARQLTHALMNAAPTLLGPHARHGGWTVEMSHGLARHLLGDPLADALDLRGNGWDRAWRALRRAIPGVHAVQRRGGPAVFSFVYEQILRGSLSAAPHFPLPESLTAHGAPTA